MNATAPTGVIRVLIVDDEPIARHRIADLLRSEPDIEVVGEAASGSEAVQLIPALAPHLVFLDVQMPGKTGFEVVEEIGIDAMPPTVFVTAHAQHALAAFESAAVDYLVKPFDDERFEQAVRRARRFIGTPAPAVRPRYADRFVVESRGKLQVVSLDDVEYITSDGPYAELHTSERRHIIREPMHLLEARLDPAKFMRIHRSTIVRLDLVQAMHRASGGDYHVQLQSGARLAVSRARRAELERRIGAR